MVGAPAGSTQAPAADGSGGTINLYAYAVPKAGFDKIIPAFTATAAGKGVTFQQSYGASGDQSRKVAAGAAADFVNFSVEPDVTRLVDAGLVDASWNSGAHKEHSVRFRRHHRGPEGQPEGDQGLGRPARARRRRSSRRTPSAPARPSGTCWPRTPPRATAERTPQAGLDYVTSLVKDHVKTQPKSGREATETFLQGSGDALISYENEAIFIERGGDPVEHVTPPQTFKIENPVAVLSKSPNAATAKAFNDFLYTPAAQTLLAQAGFRPVDEAVAKEFASRTSRNRRSCGPSTTSVAGRPSTRLALQEGCRLDRRHLRQPPR